MKKEVLQVQIPVWLGEQLDKVAYQLEMGKGETVLYFLIQSYKQLEDEKKVV